MSQTADVVICGAGITGVSAAHFLSKAGVKNILLLDEHPPHSFTSDRSTECYRNWWPNAEMLALMDRSIDLMEAFANESRNIFRMNRRGYLYVNADENKIADMENASRVTASLGADNFAFTYLRCQLMKNPTPKDSPILRMARTCSSAMTSFANISPI